MSPEAFVEHGRRAQAAAERILEAGKMPRHDFHPGRIWPAHRRRAARIVGRFETEEQLRLAIDRFFTAAYLSPAATRHCRAIENLLLSEYRNQRGPTCEK
jgi:hypothetical protein